MKKILLSLIVFALLVGSSFAGTYTNSTNYATGSTLISGTAVYLSDILIMDYPSSATGITVTAYNNSTTAVAEASGTVLFTLNATQMSAMSTAGKFPYLIDMATAISNNSGGEKREVPTYLSNGLVIRVEAGTNSITTKAGTYK